MSKRIGRNELCPCGSGKKYKKCCLGKTPCYLKAKKSLKSIWDAGLDIEQKDLRFFLSNIDQCLQEHNMSVEQESEIAINVLQYYVLAGYDEKALSLLDIIDVSQLPITSKVSINSYILRALMNTGKIEEALYIIGDFEADAESLKWDNQTSSSVKSGAIIEIGKTYSLLAHCLQSEGYPLHEIFDELESKAKKCYESLIQAYDQGLYHDIDHYSGSIANLGRELLFSTSASDKEKGIELIDRAVSIKIKSGNWVGVSNDYNSLSRYYLEAKDYKNAIAYIKRDLIITEKYSSARELITTLLNMADLYIVLRQITEARRSAQRALNLSKKVMNKNAITACFQKLQKIEEAAKELSVNKEGIGKNSPCICGSGRRYKECCGITDFDYNLYYDVMGLDKILPYATFREVDVNANDSNRRDDLSQLLRKIDNGEIRLSLARILKKGGYSEIYELPDMTSIHLVSAKTLIKNFPESNFLEEVSVALSVTMLSVSALESFVNQLAYFFGTVTDLPKYLDGKIPHELLQDVEMYQRNTRLIDKINTIFSIICNGNWDSDQFADYKKLNKLIAIRNELVHFKSLAYYRVIPPQTDDILKDLDPTIELRNTTNSWPFKLLTKSFSEWCLCVTENTINYVKDGFQKCAGKD